jgi:hypothetical protein
MFDRANEAAFDLAAMGVVQGDTKLGGPKGQRVGKFMRNRIAKTRRKGF